MGGDGATSDLWGLKRRKEKVGGKMMEEVGRQVLTNAEPAVQPGLWGGTEVRKALSEGDGEPLMRGGQLGDRDTSAAGPRMPMDTALLGWDKVSALCRGGGVTPNQLGVQLLVPISPTCSVRGQVTAWGTS